MNLASVRIKDLLSRLNLCAEINAEVFNLNLIKAKIAIIDRKVFRRFQFWSYYSEMRAVFRFLRGAI